MHQHFIRAVHIQHDAPTGHLFGHKPLTGLGRADDHIIAVGIGAIADTLDDLQVKLPVKVAEAEQDRAIFCGNALMLSGDVIAGFPAQRQNSLPRFLTDVFSPVQHIGYSGRRHLRHLRNFLDPHAVPLPNFFSIKPV